MVIVWRLKSQQFSDSGRSSLMDGGANGHLHGLQVQLAALAPISENSLELAL
jgi:hypothetical protein